MLSPPPKEFRLGFDVFLRLASLGAAFLAAAAGCSRSDSSSSRREDAAEAPWFEDATAALGLDFIHDAGAPGSYFMPEVMGSGAALFDCDNDGRLDIYLLQNGGEGTGARNQLYRQGADGRFADASAGSGLDVAGRGMGVAAGDLTNDGLVEVLITEYGRARLFLNLGGGRFEDVTVAAGIDNPFWGASAACVDYDRDGWLDLVVANYVVYSPTRPCSDQGGQRDYCGPSPFPGTVAKLFKNLGAGARPRFRDATVSSGLASASGPGLGVVCADFDGDRWPDIFIANDGKANHLWMNQRDGTFKEEAIFRGLALNAMGQAQADMGIAIGDADGDGLFDLYVTHLTDELHVLYKQEPRGHFIDRTAAAGLARPRWRSTGFGAVFGDFDLDGDLDLAQANGRVKFLAGPSPPGESFWEVYKERNQIFAGVGGGKFQDLSPSNAALCGAANVARALAMGDVDNDGDLDLVVSAVAAPAKLLRNVAPRRGRWLLARAVEPALGGRDAYGAEVTVVAGGRRIARIVQAVHSYESSSDPRAHFGLGTAAAYERIEVVWPDGKPESFPGGAADREVVLRRGEGEPAAAPSGGGR
jgi:hypothetical protein